MKNFNLDHIEKKTPYQIPDQFFEEMQGNVLKKIEKKSDKRTKIYPLNFSIFTSIAAALALIFGFTFLWKTNQTDFTKTSTDSTKMITKIETVPTPEVQNTNTTQNTVKENNITVDLNQNQQNTEPIVNSKNTDETYDQLLNSLTQEELAELSKNASHDIYLELYN